MKPGSKAWKNFMAKLYGCGAAVVIVGAMFKIQHWPGAGPMLIAGLSTEAVIFFFSAFEPPHEDPDWSLVYPELNASEEEKEDLKNAAIPSSGSVTKDLDRMFDEAKIEPELIQNLGEGMRALSENARQLTDISSATVATDEYVSSLKGASSKVSELSETYVKASESLTGLTSTEQYSQGAGESLMRLTQNLNSLNETYELQLKGTKDSITAMGTVNELIDSLNASVDDTKKYQENIAKLSENLSSLNSVYGNMLAAMNYNPANASA